MRIVLDSNVIVSAGYNYGTCRSLVKVALFEHRIILSAEVVAEYSEVAQRRKLAKHRDEIVAMIVGIRAMAEFVRAEPLGFELSDPKDAKILAAALSGQADILVTGNLRHFPQPTYGSVRILSPRQALDLLS